MLRLWLFKLSSVLVLTAGLLVVITTIDPVQVRAGGPWWNPQFNTSGRVTDLTKYVQPDPPRWTLVNGLAVETGQPPDPSTPPSLTLIAGSATDPGTAIAAGASGVWRRTATGQWSRSLLLLPQGLLQSQPAVTGIAAFSQARSRSVYLATDGYGVLLTDDDGQTWIRDDAGLPDHVLTIATVSPTRDVVVGTDSGVWVHHLSALPSPPAYADTQLWWRWLGIALTTLLVVAGGGLALRRIPMPTP